MIDFKQIIEQKLHLEKVVVDDEGSLARISKVDVKSGLIGVELKLEAVSDDNTTVYKTTVTTTLEGFKELKTLYISEKWEIDYKASYEMMTYEPVFDEEDMEPPVFVAIPPSKFDEYLDGND